MPTALDVIRNDGATALVNGNNGLEPVAGHKAMEICIEKAKLYGMTPIFRNYYDNKKQAANNI